MTDSTDAVSSAATMALGAGQPPEEKLPRWPGSEKVKKRKKHREKHLNTKKELATYLRKILELIRAYGDWTSGGGPYKRER